jgi:serine/threonine protein kinase
MDSVETICNTLARYKVLDAETVRTLRSRWREQNKDRADQPAEFKKWLTKTGHVTDFQLDLLTRGFGDHLFLDEYKLIDRLAKGRHAGVFQAVHDSGQQVAIKVLPPSKSKNPHVLGRFLRESRLATRLDHDNIVRTFHHGKTPEGTHFIVMEYLDGDTLEDVIQRRKRLPPAEAVALLIQGLEGLQHIDEKSMVHRDIKPANLMLVKSSSGKGPNGTPHGADIGADTLGSTLKILDIGLSRALFDEGEPDSEAKIDLTREGTLLGTMNYMAPEQARNAHGADIRADIYGLGCVLYEMLSGQPPFADKNLAVQIRRHAEETPKPLTETAPGTPEALDKIVQKMLAKDPAMRYLTPGQAIKDLRGILNTLGDQGTAAKPVRPLKTFMTWVETKREPADDKPQAAVGAEAPAQTKVAVASVGTVLGQTPTAPASKTMVAMLAPNPALTAATAVAPRSAATVVGAKPATAKTGGFLSALSTVAAGSKAILKKLAQSVLALKGRDWAMIGVGALIVLSIEGAWSLIRWLFF